MKKEGMQRIGAILPKVLKRRGMYEHAVASGSLIAAEEWIGNEFPLLAHELVPSRCKDGVLTVLASSAIALMRLSQRKEELRAFVSERFPDAPCSEVRVRRA